MAEPTTQQEAEAYLDDQVNKLCRCGSVSRRLVDHSPRCWYVTRATLWRGYALSDAIAQATD